MTKLTREVLAWSASHHTTITSVVLRDQGISLSQQRRLVRDGVIQRLIDGSYRFTGAKADELTLCASACSHASGLVVAGPTAGRLWGLRRMPADRLVHVIAPPASHPTTAPWLKAYRTAMLDPAHVVDRGDGIRLTCPPRTVVDLARHLTDTDLRSVIDQLVHREMCTPATMLAVAETLATPGRPWARRFIRVLTRRPDGPAPESHGESRVVAALVERGITDLTPQRWLDVPGWGRVRLDAAVDRVRWGIEIDGHPEHFTEAGATRDRERDLACDAFGWRVSRVTGASLDREFSVTIDRLMAVYRQRSREIARLARDER